MTRRSRLTAVVAAAVLLAGAVSGTAAAAAAGRLNLLNIESLFICTSCHEPLELVSSPQAQAEKAFLQTLINQGGSLAEIKRQMVAAYGEAVLAAPPASGFNLLVYVLPPAAVLAGLLLLAFTLPRWRRRARAAPQEPDAPALTLVDQRRLQEELERFG